MFGQRNAQVRKQHVRSRGSPRQESNMAAPRTAESDESGQDAQSEEDSNAPQAGIAMFCEFLSAEIRWKPDEQSFSIISLNGTLDHES